MIANIFLYAGLISVAISTVNVSKTAFVTGNSTSRLRVISTIGFIFSGACFFTALKFAKLI
jgi:hypothetical protein